MTIDRRTELEKVYDRCLIPEGYYEVILWSSLPNFLNVGDMFAHVPDPGAYNPYGHVGALVLHKGKPQIVFVHTGDLILLRSYREDMNFSVGSARHMVYEGVVAARRKIQFPCTYEQCSSGRSAYLRELGVDHCPGAHAYEYSCIEGY